MNYGDLAEKLMGMSDESWERHANPWSGWTRVLLLPLFAIAIWSRVWIGLWCLAPIALLGLWTWVNPRAFGRPAHTDNWMSRGVMGERVWLNRKAVPIPAHHARMAHILSGAMFLAAVLYIWGLVQLDLWMTIGGMALTIALKLWFLDRMVWLYGDMKDRHEVYHNWQR